MLGVLSLLLLAATASANFLHHYPMEPEDMEFANTFTAESLSINLTCPVFAVCGVAFDFNRTSHGVATPERRIIRHCTCPGNESCPIEPAHRVFSSIRRREYLCRPISNLRPCPADLIRPAKELVVRSPEFDSFNYYRINCLCPRHFRPKIPKRRQILLATSFYRVRFDFGRHMSYQERLCTEEEY